MAILSLVLPPPLTFNTLQFTQFHPDVLMDSPTVRCMKMALVHDLAEAIVGDITPTEFSGITKAQKHQLESRAMNTICSTLPYQIAKEIKELWTEYEESSTECAKHVKELDKFELLIQAFEYEKIHLQTHDLQEFYEWIDKGNYLKDERILKLKEELLKRRHEQVVIKRGPNAINQMEAALAEAAAKRDKR